jgi:hypothetical protein
LGHIADICRPGRAAVLAAIFAATLALAGCGGVQFEGKVFDAVGLSGERQEADPKLAERPPLLLPPNTKALPQPGNGVAVATAREDWPHNPEESQKQVIAAQKEAKASEEAQSQPLHPYIGKPTLLDKLLPGKKTEAEPVEDLPEPDASDKPPEGQSVAQSAPPKPISPPAPDVDVPNEDLFHPAPPKSYTNPTY